MPRVHRRGLRRQGMDPKRRRSIIYRVGAEGGPDWNPFAVLHPSDPPFTEKERAEVWREIRRDHVEFCIENHPGERPPGFWRFDYSGRPQRDGESDLDFAIDVLDMTADETERAKKRIPNAESEAAREDPPVIF